MSLGQNTFWIIVSIIDGEAITPLNDKRIAMQFTSQEAADAYREGHEELADQSFYISVRVPA